MAEARLNETETACVKRLAELHEQGRILLTVNDANLLGLPDEQWEKVLSMMEHLGAIGDATHATGKRFIAFKIHANAVQFARQLQELESAKPAPRDIMAEIQESAKRNPVVAWLLIGFLVLTGLLTAINQGWQLLERMGVIPAPGK